MTAAAILAALSLAATIGGRELLANGAWIADVLVRRAVGRLPAQYRDGFSAEWNAELDVVRSRRSKFATILWATMVYLRSGRQSRVLAGSDPAVSTIGSVAAVSKADAQFAMIEALALAIDAKDQTSALHIRRVQMYAVAVARACGMSEGEVEAVRMAALLHDIGKLAVPDHILCKPGPLTPEEFQKIRAHPKIGAELVANVPFPYPIAPIILGHHERWDGKGYPHGIAGDQIPLGARILSVVDYFDALMAERPYHRALTFDAAIAYLRQEAGKGLDPNAVAKFIELLPELIDEVPEAYGDTSDATDRQRGPIAEHIDGRPVGGSTVYDDIAGAHREIYSLYELTLATAAHTGVSDVMAAVFAKLSTIVPFSCAALFLFDEETETLRCRLATGLDAEIIQRIVVCTGEGLNGWVASKRRALVNARPAADLEAAGLATLSTALRSALVCPLVFEERFIGTLSVYHVEAGFYRDDHRRLLDRASEHVAAVVNNSSLFEQTQNDALTDALTGLPNGRFLSMHLPQRLESAERHEAQLSVVVMDLSRFREINDRVGHYVADRLLADVAAVLRGGVSREDVAVRWFSDKFVLLRRGVGSDEARESATALAADVERTCVPPELDGQRTIRLKIGVAIIRLTERIQKPC